MTSSNSPLNIKIDYGLGTKISKKDAVKGSQFEAAYKLMSNLDDKKGGFIRRKVFSIIKENVPQYIEGFCAVYLDKKRKYLKEVTDTWWKQAYKPSGRKGGALTGNLRHTVQLSDHFTVDPWGTELCIDLLSGEAMYGTTKPAIRHRKYGKDTVYEVGDPVSVDSVGSQYLEKASEVYGWSKSDKFTIKLNGSLAYDYLMELERVAYAKQFGKSRKETPEQQFLRLVKNAK